MGAMHLPLVLHLTHDCKCKVKKGDWCEKGGCDAVLHLGMNFFLKLVQKGRNTKRGVGAKRMGAKQS